MIATGKMCVACRSLVFLDDHPGWGCRRLFCPVCGRDSITRLGPPPPVELRDYGEVEGAVLLLAQILGPDLAAEYVRRTAADANEFYDPQGGAVIRALAQAAVAKRVKETRNGGAAEPGDAAWILPTTPAKRGWIKGSDGKRRLNGRKAGGRASGAPVPEPAGAAFSAAAPEPALSEPVVPAWLTADPAAEDGERRQLALF